MLEQTLKRLIEDKDFATKVFALVISKKYAPSMNALEEVARYWSKVTTEDLTDLLALAEILNGKEPHLINPNKLYDAAPRFARKTSYLMALDLIWAIQNFAEELGVNQQNYQEYYNSFELTEEHLDTPWDEERSQALKTRQTEIAQKAVELIEAEEAAKGCPTYNNPGIFNFPEIDIFRQSKVGLVKEFCTTYGVPLRRKFYVLKPEERFNLKKCLADEQWPIDEIAQVWANLIKKEEALFKQIVSSNPLSIASGNINR